ncbi:hypothetical protein FQA39_LY18598 [Lamprigera yunnana]|nr:hypothetical protein FQA39_LY18598 [Lamprigera yunnana]
MQRAKKKVQVIMDSSLIGAQHRVLTTKAGSYLYPSVKNVVTALTESGLIEYEKNEFQKYIKKKIVAAKFNFPLAEQNDHYIATAVKEWLKYNKPGLKSTASKPN